MYVEKTTNVNGISLILQDSFERKWEDIFEEHYFKCNDCKKCDVGENLCSTHDKEYKEKIGKKSIGRKKTPEGIMKMKNRMSGEKNPFYGKNHDFETWKRMGKKISEKRKYQILPIKDSKPELMMQLALELEGIEFIKHKPITGIPDIFIEPNICLFVDGCYWHFCSIHYHGKQPDSIQLKKYIGDSNVNRSLNNDGYIVFRIWEHDVVNNTDEKSKLISTIKHIVDGSKFTRMLKQKEKM